MLNSFPARWWIFSSSLINSSPNSAASWVSSFESIMIPTLSIRARMGSKIISTSKKSEPRSNSLSFGLKSSQSIRVAVTSSQE